MRKCKCKLEPRRTFEQKQRGKQISCPHRNRGPLPPAVCHDPATYPTPATLPPSCTTTQTVAPLTPPRLIRNVSSCAPIGSRVHACSTNAAPTTTVAALSTLASWQRGDVVKKTAHLHAPSSTSIEQTPDLNCRRNPHSIPTTKPAATHQFPSFTPQQPPAHFVPLKTPNQPCLPPPSPLPSPPPATQPPN